MTLIAPGRPVKHSKLAFATYKDQHMQPRKLAFATSKHVENFYYSSINDEKKKQPQHLFHVTWNILNPSMKMQHPDKTLVTYV